MLLIYKENKKLSTGKNRFFGDFDKITNRSAEMPCKLLIIYVIIRLLSREGVAERLLRHTNNSTRQLCENRTLERA